MFKFFKSILLLNLFILSPLLSQENTCNSEINYLLNYIEKTKCSYIRNGTVYTGVEAVEHIRQKYNYYSDEIYSAEDFIRLSASQSTMFNNPYYIKCEGQKKVKSAKWLHEALDKYRKK